VNWKYRVINIKEGLRRLGILSGATGFWVGFTDERATWDAREHSRMEHIKFQSLINSSQTLRKAAADAKEGKHDWRNSNAPCTVLAPEELDAMELAPIRKAETKCIALNSDGIDHVNIDKDGVVTSVLLSNGQFHSDSWPPVLSAYLIPLMYPILGFLIPWGSSK
jgi:hypothetical protein